MSLFRSGSSRRKAEAPGKIRVQFKGGASEDVNSDDEDVLVVENEYDNDDDDETDDHLTVTFGNGMPGDIPQDTTVVQPEAVEDAPMKKKREHTTVVQPEAVEDTLTKKKREPPVRVDISVLDSVSCTACGRQLNPYKTGALQKHPELKVVICKHCEKFLSSGEITKDKDGMDEQCRWCGEGGRLVVCDNCNSAFCKSCVMRNFSRSEFNSIYSQENWQCYICNKIPLQSLRDNYRKIRDTLKALQEKEKAKKAAVPVPSGTQSSEIGSRQNHKGISRLSYATNDGELSHMTHSQKTVFNSVGDKSSGTFTVNSKSGQGHSLNTSMHNTLLNSEDINIQSENVYSILDKLLMSTNTFRGVLQSLKSQFTLPPTSGVNIQAKKQQHARALNMSVVTYVSSLKKILTESQYVSQVEKKECTVDLGSVRLGTRQLNHLSLNSKIVPSARHPSTSLMGLGSVTNSDQNLVASMRLDLAHQVLQADRLSVLDIKDTRLKTEDGLPEVSTSGKVKHVGKVNGDLTREHSVSSHSELSGAAVETSDKGGPDCSGGNHSPPVTNSTNIRQMKKNGSKDILRDSDVNSKETLGEAESIGNGTVIVDEDVTEVGEESERSQRVSNSASDHSESEKTSSEMGEGQKSAKKSSEEKTYGSDSCPEIEQHEGQAEGNVSAHNSCGDISRDQSAASSEKTQEKSLSSETSNTYDDENTAAKFDLIKELADEMLRDKGESDEDNGEHDCNDDGDLPVTFEKEMSSEPESSQKIVSKKKSLHSPSAKDTSASRRKSEGPVGEDLVLSPKKSPGKKSIASRDRKRSENSESKEKRVTEDVAAEDGSSSDLLMSDSDDTELTTRRKKKKEVLKMAEKSRTARKKQVAAETKKENNSGRKSVAKASPSDEKLDDIDKAIEKLSKLPAMRKRKADVNEDSEDADEGAETVTKASHKAPKKARPGPKSTKKGVEYDDLSSDGNEERESDEEVDEEEADLSVTFLQNAEDQKGLSDDENEKAKKGLLEDMESENDEEDDNGDADSSDGSGEETDTAEKSVKKGAQGSNETKDNEDGDADKNGDTDEDVGRRKKIHNKLLDAKLSDSDSDIGRPKRKKKDDDDDDSFKAEKSSDSSIESDLSDSDDDDGDSDDTEDDEDEPKKKGKKRPRKKRKKKGKGGGGSEEEDSEDERAKKKGKAKRRRIKKMSNSSDDDGEDKDKEEDDDDDDPTSSKAGKRKQIRKVMSDKKLEDSTKAAAKAEEKRRKRIAAKQREFNIETITDENNPMNCPVTTKLVLEPGKEEDDEPLIEVNKKLVRKLKPHQVEAVQFMWDCMYESVKRSKKEEGAGCILAHCMGLGKTLSVIAFVHTILTHDKLLKHKTCLIVSPLNTVLNWSSEWSMWLDEEDQLEVWELAGCKQNALRVKALKDWQESGGIMIMGYEMYRNLTTGSRCKNKRQKKVFQDTLVDPGPDLVVCDEGHILKNEASAISKAMNQMRTKRRVVLTGTPLQNNLNEYHCMVSFVKPNLLGTRREFNNRFISPIQNGQCTDSTPRDFKLMKARSHVLHEMLAGCVQRRDYSSLTKFLPPKQEYVISVRMTNIQIELYEKYLELSGQGLDGVFSNKGARLFTDYQNLMKIWTHPWVLKLAEIRDEMKARYDDDDEDSFIDDDSDEEKSFDSSTSSSENGKVSDSGGEGTSAGPSSQRGTRRTRAKARRLAGEDSDPEEIIMEWKSKSRNNKDGDESKAQAEETDRSVTKEWWAAYVTEDDKLKLELSNKLYLLFEILRMCEEIGDKVLIFSQSILSLNIIENFLEVIDSKFQQECENLMEEEEKTEKEFGRSWTKNLDYYRMDGSTSAQNRQMWASSFNDLENYRARLFLISTRAGGLGINLVAANRVIIFDASWNPSHDVQSIFRVYRFGQVKPCYIYRFLAQGTMEEKIYERQVTKLSLSQRVVDEHQIERHFSANDLKELYNFKPDRWDDGTEKPTLSLPKDPLLAEILTANRHCVVSFHEHDSLLENQVEQTLTEEEKKAAWEEYENEKKGIIVRDPGMANNASWSMMAAAQILSREQIASIVQALRQQLPNVTEELFQLHLQQALRRQVLIKQEEMRRVDMMRMKEMNYYLNMVKQGHQGVPPRGQVPQNMASWMQMQQLRTLPQNPAFMGMQSTSVPWLGQTASNPISNKPEEAIDLDE